MANNVSEQQEKDGLSLVLKRERKSEPEEDVVRCEEPPKADDEARLRLRIFLS
jgi:hypothetical protein